MSNSDGIHIGTDSGATTSKTGGVRADGSIISHKLRQSSTNSQAGTAAVIAGWVEGVVGFLADNKLSWDQVRGVGLAIPGPYQSYGVLDKSANLPDAFAGWNFVSSIGSYISAVGVFIFLYMLWDTFAKKRLAGDNPWGPGATTLEWALPSPPPFHQWETLPRIR